MKLWDVAAFEVSHQFRQKSTWLYAVILIGLPILVVVASADSTRPQNAPLSLAAMVAFIGMIGMLATAAIFGDAATRDVATGTHPLFYTLPLTKPDYLGGRFTGAFVVNAILLLLVPVGLFIGTLLPYDKPTAFLPFDARTYLEPYLSLAVTNLFFTATILFGIALLARNTMSAYLGAVGLFLTYLIAANEIGPALDDNAIGAVLDPFALVLFRVVLRPLSPTEQDALYLGLPPVLFWNRLVWLAAGVAMLLFVFQKFRFDLPRRRLWFGRVSHPERVGHPERSEGSARELQIPRFARNDNGFARDDKVSVRRTFDRRTHLRQLVVIARLALSDIIASRMFQVVLLAAVVSVFLFGWDVGQIVFDTSTYHLTHLVSSIMRGPVAAAVVLLIALYAGELVWKERDARVAEIADTEPIPTWVPLAAKFLALIGMIVVFQAVVMVAGIALQAVRGYYVFELGLYVRVLFGFLLAIYVLFAAMSFTLHVVVNQKHLGHLAVLLFYLAISFAGRFDIHHGLLLFNSDPGWVYSDMNGFGPFTEGFVWFKLYWSAWALLLLVVAALFWMRGTESGMRQRLALARSRFTGGTVRAAAVAIVLIVTLGGFVFYNTNILNDYRTEKEGIAQAVDYERRLGRFRDAPQPRIVAAELRVDIHPHERFVDLRGSYVLVNKTTTRIDSVHVVTSIAADIRQLGFDRPARLVLDEKVPRTYRIYALERALQPGDSLRLTFDSHVQPRGFPERGVNTSIARNGAYFDRRWMPAIGYQESLELSDEQQRRRHRLPERVSLRPITDERAKQWRASSRDADLVDLDVVISTEADQVAVTTGEMVREWREGGRRYFRYKTEEPIQFGMPFMSARYAVREDKWKDVTLKVLYHPTHHFNIDRFISSMKGSLEYYTTNFGPYQFKELRIAEFPRYANFARGHPQTISFGEGTSLITRIEEGDVDRPFFVVAHEIAHQWWGNQVAGARVEGAGMLSETLAMYSSMMVMERTYGPEMVKKFYDFNMEMYLRGHSGGGGRQEKPLLYVGDQNHVFYNKGAVAMYVLKERIGEERINTALRRFLDKWRNAGAPYATSLDLYRELQAVTPDSVKPVLTELFETITFWDVTVSAATAERVGPGQYRVSIKVEARKLRTDTANTRQTSVGKNGDTLIVYRPRKETEVPMDEMVEIGIYETPHGKPAELEYLQRHRIRSGEQTITVMTKNQPWRVGVDPRNWLIQRATDLNVVELVPIRARGAKPDTNVWRAEYKKPKHVVRVEFEGF